MHRKVQIDFASLSPNAKAVMIDCVVDMNLLGEPIGIEIISLKHQLGRSALEEVDFLQLRIRTGVECSYDEKSDAFYARLVHDRSSDQCAAKCEAILDSKGRLLKLSTLPAGCAKRTESIIT